MPLVLPTAVPIPNPVRVPVALRVPLALVAVSGALTLALPVVAPFVLVGARLIRVVRCAPIPATTTTTS